MSRRTFNDVLVERRQAYASGDADAVVRLNAELTAMRAAMPKRQRKPRTAGQAAYVANLKRNGWL